MDNTTEVQTPELFSITPGFILHCWQDQPSENGATSQWLNIEQQTAQGLVLSAVSRSENVTGEKDGGYAIYMDVTYNDGTNKFGVFAPFNGGTHEWEYSEVSERLYTVLSLSL